MNHVFRKKIFGLCIIYYTVQILKPIYSKAHITNILIEYIPLNYHTAFESNSFFRVNVLLISSFHFLLSLS
jgi:hypothetical protein